MDRGRVADTMRTFLFHWHGHRWSDEDDIFANGLVTSLFVLRLIEFVENEFSLLVEDDDLEIENFRSIDAIADFVCRKVVMGPNGAG